MRLQIRDNGMQHGRTGALPHTAGPAARATAEELFAQEGATLAGLSRAERDQLAGLLRRYLDCLG